ncbi:hypothetical protein PT277_07800 [Acetobacteraceae bacterium ESL0709]|nr:hypothetical protein [Acetobacteraceae bacterium ESL0697]MDF7678582.1 hypothetical protein [Acetobacteraceae bacterium ESL0709]
MNDSVWYRDPFLIFLTGLLALLLGRQIFLFGRVLLRRGGVAECLSGSFSLLTCCTACCSLFTVTPLLQSFWLGLYLTFLSLQKRCAPPLFYSVMALLLFGLYPAFWSVCLVIPLLFWPAPEGQLQDGETGVSCILAVGYGFKDAAIEPLYWFLGIVILSLMAALWILYKRPGRRLFPFAQLCALTRVLLLVGLSQFALRNQLYDCMQATLCALVLDITCQVVSSWSVQWRSFALALPLLPGFVIVWFGLHAALSLAGPETSWTLLGFGLGLAIGLLSIAETVLVLVTLPSVRIDGSFMGMAALFSCLMPVLALSLAPQKEGLLILPPFQEGFQAVFHWLGSWLTGENHLLFLAQPFLWLLWGVVWFCLVNPRMGWRKPALFLSCPSFVRGVFKNRVTLLFRLRVRPFDVFARHQRLLRKQGEGLSVAVRQWWEDQPEFSLSVWLCALAFLFLAVGLSSR